MSEIVLVTGPYCTEGSATIAAAIKDALGREPKVIEYNSPIEIADEDGSSDFEVN